MSLSLSPSASTGGNYTCKLYFDPGADQSDTRGYWITDDQLRQKLVNLIDTDEEIKKASIYSNPLSSWQLIDAMFYHAFVVMETNDWWWSIEKNTKGITIQRSKKLENVRDMYQRKIRTTGSTSLTSIKENKTTEGGKTTIGELIIYIWRKDCLNDVYHLLDENCQKFADTVFNRIKLKCDDQVYFDEAADQPRYSASSCYMSVDKLFCKVQRLSASETLSQVQLYTAARLKCVILAAIIITAVVGLTTLPFSIAQEIFQSEKFFKRLMFFFIVLPVYIFSAYVVMCSILERIGLLSHHSFVIFKTNVETYWSFERFPTHYVIHRASNKDILLKECKRASQHFWIFKPKLHKEALAVKRGTIAILELIWKKDNLNSERNLKFSLLHSTVHYMNALHLCYVFWIRT